MSEFAGIFLGDGRKTVYPPAGTVLMGTDAHPITRAQARLIVKQFLASGHSTHSGMGATLWVILAYCQGQGIPYSLTAHPGMGYYVERVKDIASR